MKRPPTLRFWEKVSKGEGCWLWNGYVRPNGYGRFMLAAGKAVYAHRFAFEDAKGPIPAGLDLDHLCRNRRCVNPAHLEPVTRRENLVRSPLTQNQPRETCHRGHTIVTLRSGRRRCRSCHAEHSRNYRAMAHG